MLVLQYFSQKYLYGRVRYKTSLINVFNQSTLSTNYKTTKVDLISGVYCQEKKELSQVEIFKLNPNKQFTSINWSLIKSLPKPSGNSNFISDLLFDNDPTSKYDYKIKFDDSRVFIQFTNKDSLKFKVNIIDTNGCFNADTITISIIKKPFVSIVSSIITKCMNEVLNMNLFGSSNGTHKWIPINQSGFSTWTVLPKGDSLILGTFTKAGAYKIKLEATTPINLLNFNKGSSFCPIISFIYLFL